MTTQNFLPDSHNLPYVEELFTHFLADPASVPQEWQQYFASFTNGTPGAYRLEPSFHRSSIFNPPGNGGGSAPSVTHAPLDGSGAASLQEKVVWLIRVYRVRGHMIAKIDPLGMPRQSFPELDPAYHGISEADMDRPVAQRMAGGPAMTTPRETFARLRNTYCRSIGVQYMHIDDPKMREWLQTRMETTENRIKLTKEEQIRIFTRLTDAVIFEEFVQKKFIGSKSFSLEGGESLIPLLDMAIERAGEYGVDEIVLGMAHRGRLNVLANIMGKNPRTIFSEFEDKSQASILGHGDVKYHLGYSSDWTTTAGKKVHLTLCFNASHLEFVNPVVIGRARAKADRNGDTKLEKKLAIVIHGDSAMAGEGVVQETFNLSQLEAYKTGGTLHIVLNNQIGFTTLAVQNRSMTYCSDVAKMLQIPIFHVDGEDPEAVMQVISLAMDFRREFKSDVVIDMLCYRRRGHNEGDEPSYTQPLMYEAIRQRKPVGESYKSHLLTQGGISAQQADEIGHRRRAYLEDELAAAKNSTEMYTVSSLAGIWQGYTGGLEKHSDHHIPNVPVEKLQQLLRKLSVYPKDFALHPKLQRFFELREEMAAGKKPLDWSAGEALAFATLATGGIPVRMTGQDSERGTFSHRHAVLHDIKNESTYMPLNHLAPDQAPVAIHNSALSEVAVLGFEYGYSIDTPDGLVIWEAQFGDFVNVAQVIIDQFLCSAEEKWQRLSGLVMLLPHGFEGMGPEHSSARLERFLMLSANDNIQVVVPSTPAQMYHVLRRQMLRKWRKPLVVFTPKSLLRHPECVSSLADLAEGSFQRIIPDDIKRDKPPSRVLLCAGKIYYELHARRAELKRDDVAIIRVEQLYPGPEDELRQVLAGVPDGTPTAWVQEEPDN
ncbi:MAG: 2-oxoglutarate dehydrogenase E1 component, partial [Planctomycetes bacterium]|nr:2-oxoglutarate dehydrogenase E1 component [Planctomycetota bacterium]